MANLSARYFSEEQVTKILESYGQVRSKQIKLCTEYTTYRYRTDEANEYGKHGFARRIGTISRCIYNVFEAVPVDGEKSILPGRERLLDAAINIQASLINTFGAIDNLAWIWVYEKGVTQKNGKPLSKMKVGLSSRYEEIRNSFREDFRKYLEGMDDWLSNLGDFRDGLAHRISLYIPPSTLDPKKRPRFDELQEKINDALTKGDFREANRLEAEQNNLMIFQPLMQHSFGEGAIPLYFHPQILANFATIEELADRMLGELKAL